MKKTKRGKIYFIGAGPGDPELLTVKAKEIIKYQELRKRFNLKEGEPVGLDVFNLDEQRAQTIGEFREALGGVEDRVNEGQNLLNRASSVRDSIASGANRVDGVVQRLF